MTTCSRRTAMIAAAILVTSTLGATSARAENPVTPRIENPTSTILRPIRKNARQAVKEQLRRTRKPSAEAAKDAARATK